MSHFDYPFTCPQIDNNIESFKDTLEDVLKDFATELCPFLKDSYELQNLIKGWVDHTYDQCSDIFEDTRSANEGIRQEAERLIQGLEEEISDLKYEIKNLEE